jgi:CheY-like chemotaxis protein
MIGEILPGLELPIPSGTDPRSLVTDTSRLTLQRIRDWDEQAETRLILLMEDVAEPTPLGICWEMDLKSVDEASGERKEFFQNALHRGTIQSCDYRSAHRWLRDLVRPKFNASGEVIGLTGLTIDISAAKAAEESALQTAGLAAISRTSARVVHDANNLAMIIAGYGEDILHSLPADSPLKDNVKEILAAAERLSGLAGKLAPYTPQPPQQMELVPIGSAHVLAPKKLVADATKALSARGTLTTSVETPQHLTNPSQAKRQVQFTCRNEKEVLSPDQVQRIFEPDLSAHPTGASLAAVYQLANQCGGTVSCTSTPTQGTTITVSLPIASAASERLTVLAVDDEASIRGLISRALPHQNYTVLEAADAEEALHKARTADRPIDILITDIMMPESSGLELAEAFHLVCPGAKILFISGYTGESGPDLTQLPPGTAFLSKPFTLTSLEAKVKEMLSTQSAAAGA